MAPNPATAVTVEPGLRRLVSAAVPAVTLGVVLGTVELLIAASFAAMVFSGDLAPHLPAGMGLVLLGAAVSVLVVTLGSSLSGTIASVQDSPAAVMAVAAGAVATAAAGAGRDPFLTVVAVLVLATSVTGAALYAIGRFGLGDLVRFLPYPVVGGFLAGTGWLLVGAGIEVTAGIAPGLETVGALVATPALVRWVPAVALALVLSVAARRWRHYLVLPGILVAVVLLFHVGLRASGTALSEAAAGRWLLGPFPAGGLWRWWTPSALSTADWGTVLASGSTVGAVVLVSIVALLLNATGIELSLRSDADVNRELRVSGAANLAGGAVGGLPGFHALSLTVLAHRAGAGTRATGVIMALVCGAGLVLGGSVFGFVPTLVVGGLLLFLGGSFLVEWLWDARRALPAGDYALVWLILVVVATAGFLVGVLVGLVAAVGKFVFAYSRVDAVKHTGSGATWVSRVERPRRHRERLRTLGEQVHVLELQGYVFFGTADQVVTRTRARIDADDEPPLTHLVLDFARVTGLDSSAVMSFEKVRQLAARAGATLVLSNLDATARRQLRASGVLTDGTGVRVCDDLDRALEWVEARLLDERAEPVGDLRRWLAAVLGDDDCAVALRRRLKPVELAPGEQLVAQGDEAGDLYFVERGTLTVTLEDGAPVPLRLGLVQPGTVIGEVGVYLGTRAAAVVAETPSRLQRLSARSLAEIERSEPALAAALHRALARRIAERLADTGRALATVRA